MQKIVLTREEKQVAIFVLSAFLLGVSVKYYRDKHRVTTPIEKIESASPSPKTKRSR